MALQGIMTRDSLTRQAFRMTVVSGTYPSGGNYEITASLAGSRRRSCRDGHVRRPCRMEAVRSDHHDDRLGITERYDTYRLDIAFVTQFHLESGIGILLGPNVDERWLRFGLHKVDEHDRSQHKVAHLVDVLHEHIG